MDRRRLLGLLLIASSVLTSTTWLLTRQPPEMQVETREVVEAASTTITETVVYLLWDEENPVYFDFGAEIEAMTVTVAAELRRGGNEGIVDRLVFQRSLECCPEPGEGLVFTEPITLSWNVALTQTGWYEEWFKTKIEAEDGQVAYGYDKESAPDGRLYYMLRNYYYESSNRCYLPLMFRDY